MLFSFDKSILNIESGNVSQFRAIENLLAAHHNRYHLVFIEMSDWYKIKDVMLENLSLGGKATFNEVGNKSIENKNLLSRLKYRVVIYIEDHSREGVYRIGLIWYVPLKLYASVSMLSAGVIGENPSDATFYICLAGLYATKHGINKSYITVAREICGGGSVTPKVVSCNLKNYLSPLLCITDSDKYHPTYKRSSAVLKIERIKSILDNKKIFEYVMIEEREVENLMPKNFLEKICPNFHDFLDFVDGAFSCEHYWKYLDLKQGVSINWLNKHPDIVAPYWSGLRRKLVNSSKGCLICLAGEIDKCKCEGVKAFGNELLVNAIEYIKNNKDKITLRMFEDDLRWEYIAATVVDFSIAAVGERARA